MQQTLNVLLQREHHHIKGRIAAKRVTLFQIFCQDFSLSAAALK